MPETTPSPAEQAPTSLSPDAAASRIEALLTPEQPETEQQETEAQAPEETVDTETPETPEVSAQEAPEGEDEPAETPDAEPEEDDDPLIAIKIDGKEVPVPFSEVQNGYMRTADYTKKLQAVAEKRKALEQHEQMVVQERTVYSGMLGQLEQALAQMNGQEPDWQALQAHGQQTGDVSQYWIERARWDEHQRNVTAIREDQARVQQLQHLETVEKLKAHLAGAQTYLVEQIPAWKDEKRATADKTRLKAYAKKLGYNDQEIAHAYDPRMIIALHKAAAYDDLMASKPRPTHDLHRVLRPGSIQGQQTSQGARITKAKQRLAKTGRPDDAVAALEAILG